MPALTAGQLTTLRSRPHTHRLRMSIINPTALLTAQVNGTVSRSATSIPYDTGTGSGFADIQAGYTLKITNQYGDRLVRVRSISGSQASGTITVTANDIVWDDGATLVIYENWQDYPMIARFTAAGTFFKDWDITYTDQTDQTLPVCIAGPHRVGELTGASITFSFDLTESYVTYPTASISSYGLTVTPASGVTVTDNLDGTFDVDITTAGEYWAAASVTDSNGKSQTTYRRIIVHDSGYPYLTNFSASINGEWSRGGWTARIEVKGGASTVQDYALVLIWQEQKFAGTEDYLNPAGSPLLFAGYMKPGTARYNYDLEQVSFEAVTAEALLREEYSYAVTLEAVGGTPDTWYKYNQYLTSGLTVHHLLAYHSTILKIVDVYGLMDDYTAGLSRRYAEAQGSDLYQICSSILAAVQSKLVTSKLGQMRAMKDVQLLGDAERGALPVVFDIGKQDTWRDTSLVKRPPGASRVRVHGLSYRGTGQGATGIRPYLSKAPGDTYFPRGRPPHEIGNQVLNTQDYANELSGRALAIEQNPVEEVRQMFDGGYADVLDFATPEFYTISLTGNDNPLGLVWTTKKLICRGVRLQHDPRIGGLTVDVAFEPEALGADGQTEEWDPDPPDTTFDLPELPEIAWPELPPLDLGDITNPIPPTPPNTGSLITWGGDGVHVRLKSLAVPDWSPRNTMEAWYAIPALSGGVDPFWTLPEGQQTLNPVEAVVFRCEIGVIYRSTDGGSTWLEVQPVDDPPNSWGDTTPPIVAELYFEQMTSSLTTQGTHYFSALWQEPDSGLDKWRSWLLVTEDDGATWSWVNLGQDVTAPDSEVTDKAISLDGGATWQNTADLYFDTSQNGFSILTHNQLTAEIANSSLVVVTPTGCDVAGNLFGTPLGTWSASYGFENVGIAGSQCQFRSLWIKNADIRLRAPATGLRTSNATITTYGGVNKGCDGTYKNTDTDHAVPCYGFFTVAMDSAGVDYNYLVGTGHPVAETVLLGGTTGDGAQFNYNRFKFVSGTGTYSNNYVRILDNRILWTDGNYALVVGDDTLQLLTVNASNAMGYGSSVYIGDATNAEIDAGTYSAAGFVDSDGNVYVYGNFDCTAGDTGLTGVQHVIKYDGSSWSSIESGWATDHCGAFVAGFDAGSGARYWGVRNTATNCQLYSDIGSLTLIATIAPISVRYDTFVILDGVTMYAASKTAAAAMVYESTDGGTTWSDITGSHAVASGIRKMSLL